MVYQAAAADGAMEDEVVAGDGVLGHRRMRRAGEESEARTFGGGGGIRVRSRRR